MRKFFSKIILICFIFLGFISPVLACEVPQEWLPFMKNLQSRIKSNWHPDKSKKSLSATVLFTVSRSGEISNLKMYQSSGNEKYDALALKTTQQSAPFSDYPQRAKEENVDVRFTYSYNVFGISLLPRSDQKILENYNKELLAEINKNIQGYSLYPKNREVALLLEVVNGEYAKVQSVKVLRSSGDKRFDERAINNIKKANMLLPPIPPELKNDKLQTVIKMSTKPSKKKTALELFFGALTGFLTSLFFI